MTTQEAKTNGYVQKVASLTHEVLDPNTGCKNSNLIDWEKLNDNRDRLTKIVQWTSESLDVMLAWNQKELTRLCIENSATPPQQSSRLA